MATNYLHLLRPLQLFLAEKYCNDAEEVKACLYHCEPSRIIEYKGILSRIFVDRRLLQVKEIDALFFEEVSTARLQVG